MRSTSSGRLTFGLRVGEVLGVSSLADASLVAGESGLDRVVQRLNVMEVPDILPWVKPHELLLTTGYPLRHTPQALAGLVADLDERGLAAIAIKLGRYIDDLPHEMLARADHLGFPIIRLPEGVAFDDILNQVLTDILNRQAAILSRSEEVHRALVQIVLAGGDVQEVTDELAGLLDGAVLVTESDGHVLASSGSPEDLAAARAAPCFDRAGRLRGSARPGVHSHRGTSGSYAVVPIVAGALDHGRIIAHSRRRELGEMDVHALERAATVAALATTKRLAVNAVESKYQGDFLRELVSGRAGGPDRTVAHSASLGWDIDRPVIVVVAELDPAPGEEAAGVGGRRPRQRASALQPLADRFASAWQATIRARDPGAAVVGFSRELVAIMGTPRDGHVGRLVQQIAARVAADPGVGERSFTTGISRTVMRPADIPVAYEQARRAVAVGRRTQGPGAVANFDDLGVFRLLSLIPEGEELREFVTEALGELAARDDPETTDLRRTLLVLLETNLNVAETARRLHFHYNTLRYRIGKLERMLGPFTDDPHLRLNLMLALQVLQMRGASPGSPA